MKLKSDLPIKYQIKTHRFCDAYPNETDVLYDIIEYVFSSNKRKKTWKVEDIVIQMDSIKNVFPDICDENFKEKIKTILSTLHKNNMIAIVDGKIAVTTDGVSKLYEI